MSELKPDVLANLLERLKADGGRYLLSIALTKEERGPMLPPTYGSKGYTRWLTEDEHAALCAALAPSPDTAALVRVLLDAIPAIDHAITENDGWAKAGDESIADPEYASETGDPEKHRAETRKETALLRQHADVLRLLRAHASAMKEGMVGKV